MAATLDLGQLAASLVPIQIEAMRLRGGPTREDWALAARYAQTLGNYGDVLMYGSNRQRVATAKQIGVATLSDALVHPLAVLAFLPGGYTFLGQRFEALP